MARTQRVQSVIENFMEYHNRGYSVKEIAEKFDVDCSTVYHLLQEIADRNNVSRESLLERVICRENTISSQPFLKEKVDIEKLRNDFNEIDKHIDEIISEIDKILII